MNSPQRSNALADAKTRAQCDGRAGNTVNLGKVHSLWHTIASKVKVFLPLSRSPVVGVAQSLFLS